MKIAIVHDYIKEYGGAERVLEALHEIYPDAPVYTSVYLPKYLGPHKERFKDWNIKTSFLQCFPFKAKLISPFRLLSPFAFRQFDFSGFDVVIVSATGAYFPNVIRTNKEGEEGKIRDNMGAKHITYCHTPPRYLYGYATARNWKKNILFRILGETANHFLRMIDYKAAQNVDFFIANSEEVKARIWKFYRKEAKVIYPPVETSIKYKVLSVKGNHTKYLIQNTKYYLAGGRLARAKHIDLIVRACRELNVQLKVFGKGFAGYEEELKKSIGQQSYSSNEVRSSLRQLADRNVNVLEFLGEVTDEEKFELMKGAKAYIFAGEDEDFGILPVEAMAAGIPVITHRSGGVKETVIEGKTGLFFDELTEKSLIEGIKKFEKMKFEPEVCRKQAEKFSTDKFRENILKVISQL